MYLLLNIRLRSNSFPAPSSAMTRDRSSAVYRQCILVIIWRPGLLKGGRGEFSSEVMEWFTLGHFKYCGNLLRLVQCIIQGHCIFRSQILFLLKQAKMGTGHPWNLQISLLGLLKAAKLVIVRSLFCNCSMNTKPGLTAFA